MSSIIDYTDRATCVLFGDGAGAVVLSAAAPASRASSTSSTRSTAAAAPRCACPPAAAGMPASHETVDQRLHYVKQDGQTVFKFAVRKTEEIARRLLERNGLEPPQTRSVRVAPGEPPHHRGRDRAPRARPRQGHHQPRAVRQHHRRRRSRWRSPTRVARTAEEGRLVLLRRSARGSRVGAVLLRWSL